jgi:TonB-linked SusC/RagA family outer membrane protein
MWKEAYANDGITPGPTIYDLTGAWDIKKSTDWQKELMDNNASVTNIQTAVSGGNEISQYTFGGGYRKEKPMFPGNFSDQKVSVHFKLNTSGFNNKFKAMLSGNFLSDNNLLPTIDITTQALSLPPNAPDGFNADGTINWQNGTYSSNPYQFLLSQYRGKTNNLVASSLLSYDILPGLQLKSSFGYNLMHVREINNKTIASQLNFPGAAAPSASAKFSDNNISSWIIEPQITYEQNIGKGKLSGLLGLTLQQNLFDGQIILAEGYTNDAFLGSLAAASQISKDASPYEQYKYTAAYGRVNYNFADRYILNLTARRDGSSRFGPGKQFGNFGAIGAAWLFTNESFLKDKLLPLSFGKLRASYGTVGNQPASNYGYLELYDFNTGSLSYQGGQALKPINIYAPDFSWEVSEKLEVGIELGFLQDKVLFSASYFRNHSDNQLVSYSLPKISGFSSITANLPAKVENKGWEFTLNTTNISSKSFTWSSSFNFTASENRLQSFPGIENTYYNSSLIIGKSLGITKAYNYARVDPETGVYQFYNASGALTFTPDFDLDRTVLIDTDPKFYGGLQNNFSYGNFELGVFFTFVKQQGLTPAFTYNNPPGASRLNRYAEALDRWQKTGDEATYQKFTSRNFGEVYDAYKYAQESSFAYTDASYIRLKNLSLAWRLPKALQQKMGLSNMRIYVHGQNLLTITGYKGVDPEAQSVTALPPLRVWTAGIQLTL